jgi:hypothetical protein
VGPEGLRKELLPEQSSALLAELHLLTRDGHLNADALRKLKQVNHLAGLLAPALADLAARHREPQVVDLGSGNGYLPFVLCELHFRGEGGGRIACVEARPDLAARMRARAERLGYARLEVVEGRIEDAPLPERVHLVTALHACDTATDDALLAGLARGADWIALVPCCQAEVAAQLKAAPAGDDALAALSAHPWHRREFGSHLTNVIRALVLEASGYQVTVTELTGWEHSLKNELLLARRVHRESRPARARLEALLARTGVRPKVVRGLGWGPLDAAPPVL